MIPGAGILLMAAGLSRRYRQQCGQHKLTAIPPGDNSSSLLERNLALATALVGSRVSVVLRPEDHLLISLAHRSRCAVTLLESDGLGSSIAAGVATRPDWSGWVIMLADMPCLQQNTVRRVFQALRYAETVRPVWQHRPGHPVGFGRALRDPLLALSGEDGARSLLHRWPPLQISVNDPGCVWDIDVPSDWHKEF